MHSHTQIQYLVKRAEELAGRRDKKDIRPGWLTHFIQEVADLFEPATDAARVGFDCRYDTNEWLVLFYLGDAEIFGGIHDGKRARIAFDFDLKNLLDRFETVESLRYQALPEDLDDEVNQQCALIEVTGMVRCEEATQQLTVGILSHPPKAAGPGVRILPNGNIEPA